MGRDWHAWHQRYADPSSSLSRRLAVVREQLGALLRERGAPTRLLSLCAGDGRDALPVLAAHAAAGGVPVRAVLVELDEDLAAAARAEAARLGVDVDVRTADAGRTAAYADAVPADLLMLCGVLGNVTDADAARTLDAVPGLLAPGGVVVWTRGRRVDHDPTRLAEDPSEHLRARLLAGPFEEVAFVRPDDADFRVGVHRLVGEPAAYTEARLFDFV